MQAAMMEPSRTPSTRWLKMRERMTADVTRVTSKYTLNFPNSLFHESLGTHHGNMGFYFEDNTDGLHEAANE